MDSFRNVITIALAIAMLVTAVSSATPKKQKDKNGITDDIKNQGKIWDSEKKHRGKVNPK